jgi:glutamate/tyrosine decarboxylase-like PLP-dependent enzyme
MELAETAEGMVRTMPHWEVVSPAQLGVLAIRYAPPGTAQAELDQIQRALVNALIDDGYAMVATTVLRGTTVLRFCTINPRTTVEDLRESLALLDRYARMLAPESCDDGTGARYGRK